MHTCTSVAMTFCSQIHDRYLGVALCCMSAKAKVIQIVLLDKPKPLQTTKHKILHFNYANLNYANIKLCKFREWACFLLHCIIRLQSTLPLSFTSTSQSQTHAAWSFTTWTFGDDTWHYQQVSRDGVATQEEKESAHWHRPLLGNKGCNLYPGEQTHLKSLSPTSW